MRGCDASSNFWIVDRLLRLSDKVKKKKENTEKTNVCLISPSNRTSKKSIKFLLGRRPGLILKLENPIRN